MGLFQTRLFLCLLCGHVLGDFYLQPPEMAEGKNRSWPTLAWHAGVYAGAIFLLALPDLQPDAWLWVLVPMAAHGAIDAGKALVCRKYGESAAFRLCEKHGYLFLTDQLLHLAVLAATALAIGDLPRNALGRWMERFCTQISGVPEVQVLAVAALVLLLGKPANVLLKRLNRAPRQLEEQAAPPDRPTCVCPVAGQVPSAPHTEAYPNAGAIIGTLERLLVALLCVLGQYAAIGLVFAAKTLTRYDRIVKDPPFAEYYLIGTLGSLLFALCATRLLLS